MQAQSVPKHGQKEEDVKIGSKQARISMHEPKHNDDTPLKTRDVAHDFTSSTTSDAAAESRPETLTADTPTSVVDHVAWVEQGYYTNAKNVGRPDELPSPSEPPSDPSTSPSSSSPEPSDSSGSNSSSISRREVGNHLSRRTSPRRQPLDVGRELKTAKGPRPAPLRVVRKRTLPKSPLPGKLSAKRRRAELPIISQSSSPPQEQVRSRSLDAAEEH